MTPVLHTPAHIYVYFLAKYATVFFTPTLLLFNIHIYVYIFVFVPIHILLHVDIQTYRAQGKRPGPQGKSEVAQPTLMVVLVYGVDGRG